MATLNTLVNFPYNTNREPGRLLVDAGGNVLGALWNVGPDSSGEVFAVGQAGGVYAGTLTVVGTFTDDASPSSILLADANGDLFGETVYGGPAGDGTLFEIAKTASGYASAPISLASFDGVPLSGPSGGLTMDAQGDLFGTASGRVFELAKTATGYAAAPSVLVVEGGASTGVILDSSGDLFGIASSTVFELKRTQAGATPTATGYATTATVLAQLTGSSLGGLTADASGNLFGTTFGTVTLGGAADNGAIFEIARTATGYAPVVTLASFGYSNGANPAGPLTIDANGNLFGTTAYGGPNDDGTVFELARTATGYATAPTVVTGFGQFAQSVTGPESGVVADASGNLFGTTVAQGTNGGGTLFEVTGSGFATVPSGPTVLSDTAVPATGTYSTGQSIAFTLALSAPVTVSGAPVLVLNDGGTADYDAAASTSTSLAFVSAIANAAFTPTLAVTGLLLQGGTIADSGGNALDVAGAVASFAGLTVRPTFVAGPQGYQWNGNSGRWNNGGNWTDATNPGLGTAPGASDTATIAGNATYGSGFDLIDGPGAAAVLNTSGALAFTGSLTFGTWNATGYSPTLLGTGVVANIGTATLNGEFQLSDATLDVGLLTLGASLNLFAGSSLQVGSLPAASTSSIALDATSRAEFGTAGIGTAGTIAIDPGVTVSLETFSAPVLDDGVLLDTQYMYLDGGVSGTGQVAFANTGTSTYLGIAGAIGAGIDIAFTGTSQNLSIDQSGTVGFTIAAGISGFAAGDSIDDYAAAVTGAAYTATGTGIGTLAFTGAGGAVIQTLTLLGDYTGDTFTFVPEAGYGGTVELGTAATSLPTPTPAVTNPGTDAYRWSGGAAGFWDVAANWTDTTTNAPATVAPGVANAAVIAGPTAYNASPLLITGNGLASTVTASGSLALNGAFAVSSFAIGLSNTYDLASLLLLPGSALATTTSSVYGTLDLQSAALSATGTVTLGSDYTFGSANLTNGASITAGRLYSVFAPISIDATSSVEVGTAGGAALGAFTVDSGALASFYADTSAFPLVNNGTVNLISDYYRSRDEFDGPVTGTGLMLLGANNNYGYVAFGGSVAATQTIQEVSSESTIDLLAGAAFAAAVTGLQSTDAFLVAPGVTRAAYAGGNDSGTLTLTDATGTVVRTLDVGGTGIGGDSFVVLPGVNDFGKTATEILLMNGPLQVGPPPAAAAGGARGGYFTWATNAGGAWNDPANWGSLAAPGSLDTVNLNTPGGFFQVISGSGNALSATESAANALSGQFDFGTLTLNQNATANGLVDVVAGATLDAGSVTLNGGTLEAVGAGAVIAVAGTLALSSSAYFSAEFAAYDGASIQVGGNVSVTNPGTVYSDPTITVDGTSRLEVGTAGGAAAGALTVDAGATLTGAAGVNTYVTIDAAVVDDGVLGNAVETSGTIYQSIAIDGAVTGTGTLLVGSGRLSLYGPVAASETIAFSGPGGTLVLASPTSATITGFGQGDAIQIGGTLTAASYVATGPGTGVLTVGGPSQAQTTLNLVGDYTSAAFLAEAGATIYTGTTSEPGSLVSLAAPAAADTDFYTIAGTRAGQATTDAAAIAPFAALTLANPNAAATGTATVVLSAPANGTLSNLAGGTFDGTTYTVAGSTAALQAALDGLVFTPTAHETAPGGTETTGFVVAVADAVPSATATDATTSVVATAAAYDVPQLTQIYTDELGRAPSAAELSGLDQDIAAGYSLPQIRDMVDMSQEGQNAIGLLYASVLGRLPSAGELSLLTTDEQNGYSLATLRAATAAGSESQNEQMLVYADELGRLPTAAELAVTTSALAGGLSLGGLEAMTAMLPEAQAALDGMYLATLGRLPSAGEQATLTTDLGEGYTLAQLRSLTAGFPEAQTALSALYQGVLARAPTTAELSVLTGELQAGSTLDAIRASAAQGPEGQDDVAALVANTLGTVPTTAELADATVQLASGIGQAALVAELIGLASNPTITSDATSTTLVGTAGVDVFAVGAAAADTLTGFDPAHDIIQVSRTQVADYPTFVADLAASGGGTLLTLDATHSVLIQGVAPGAIGAANLRFV